MSKSTNRGSLHIPALATRVPLIARIACQALLTTIFAAPAFGACTFTVSPSSLAYVDSLGRIDLAGDPLVVQITTTDQTCPWTADASDGFATVTGAHTGTGNGAVTYSIPANTTGIAQTATLNIAGNAITLTQRGTPATFADVFPNDPFFDGINLMRTDKITSGCAAVPQLLYCSGQNVTRDQMAVFIVRTILGGGPNVDNFQYSGTPYFTDVPPTYQFFKWIQKMRELGITSGTTATTYGPLLPVTRGQMAVFIVRARLGASTTFTYNPTPYFTDVPANYQFFKWIQKLKEIGITSGTTATTYSPEDAVTRGEMAVFLIRAGFNDLLKATAPLITSAAPNHGAPGTVVNVAVTGINTHFASDTTLLAQNGITADTPVVADAAHFTVNLTIPPGTPLGQISITAETPSASEEATLPNGFTIGTGDPVPTIVSFTPASGPVGTLVTLTGTTLVSSLGTPVSVLVPLQGGGVTGAPVTASSSTSLSFVIPSTAATGNITLSSSSGTVTSTSPFTVVPSSTYTISAVPSSATVIAGQSTTYTVTSSTSSGFSGIAQLSLSGLQTGLTATFNPPQISVGQQSILTITAPASQTTSSANLAISANATVDGLPVPAATNATLVVTPVTTSFLGRTTVDDTSNTSLAGVVINMVGQDGSGHTTGCTGSTISDGSGNFALTSLPASCLGPQLIGFVGNTVTSPAGKYAGLQLVFTLVSNQVVVSPVLVHLPRVDNVETFMAIQNDAVDQTYRFQSIPGLSITVYAGTVFTEQDNSKPDPFPLAAIEVPVDRLPDLMPVTSASVTAFIVAFQPAETNASKAVAVSFPNTLNTSAGTNVPLMTLDPTLGRMAPYGTGTVSNDATTIIPDIDPSTGSLNHRYGIIHFDWHGAAVNPPPVNNPAPYPAAPTGGDPVDLSSGIDVQTSTDLVLNGSRGSVSIVRTYRTLNTQAGPFGIGGFHNFEYRLDTNQPQNLQIVNLALPNGTRIPFTRQIDGTLINTTVPVLAGAVMSVQSDGTVTLRFRTGDYFRFMPNSNFPLPTSFLMAMGDPNGNVTTIVRPPGSPSQISEIDDPVGRKLLFVYDGSNRITSITDPMGRAVSYAYDSNGNLATFTNVLGGVTQYLYDSQNRTTKITDPRGVVTAQTTYDSNGRVSTQRVAGGGIYTFAYTLINALVPTSPVSQTTVTDPNGHITVYRFNSQGFLVSVTDPSGQTRTFTLQFGTNLLTGISGPGSCAACGDPGGGDLTFSYDSSGNRLTETDALGNIVHYTYDSFGNVLSILDAQGNQTAFVYDSRGNLVSVTDPRGNTTNYTVNSAGLTTQVQDETGHTTLFTYDTSGNIIQATDPLGHVTKLGWDAVSRLVAKQDPMGRIETLAYNALDQWTSFTDGNGLKTSMTFDNAGYMKTYSDPNGGKVTFSYDTGGRISARTDQLNNSSTFSYDGLNNLVSDTNRRGQAASFGYDALNRLVAEQYADGAQVQRVYDSAGRLVQVVDSVSGTFSLAYDLTGRPVKSTGPFGVVSYTRDANHRVVTRQVAGEPVVTYSYDANGNLTGAAMAGAAVNQTYDARNRTVAVNRSNGVNDVLAYDAAGQQLSEVEQSGATTILSRSYTYDPDGELTGLSNESGKALATPVASSTVNAANQLVSAAGTAYTYDADGNRLTEVSASGTTSYAWDARGRLQAIQSPGGVVSTFLYDYDGNLIQKRIVGGTGSNTLERYVLDDLTNVVSVEQVGIGTVPLLTGRSVDEHWATVSNGSPLFASPDRLNSTAALTDTSGNVVGRSSYEPFGHTTSTGSASYSFLFTGRQQISGDLYYLRARYLDTANGRFLTEDPLGIEGGSANLYEYVGNNPMNWIDPVGLEINLNLFPPDSDNSHIHGKATEVTSTGNYKVGGHGSPDGFFGPDGKQISAKDLAARIKADPKYKAGSPVDLLSCNTGSKGTNNPFGKQLAKELGAPVNAPTNYAWYYAGGGIVIAPAKGGDLAKGPDLANPGKLRQFQP